MWAYASPSSRPGGKRSRTSIAWWAAFLASSIRASRYAIREIQRSMSPAFRRVAESLIEPERLVLSRQRLIDLVGHVALVGALLEQLGPGSLG